MAFRIIFVRDRTTSLTSPDVWTATLRGIDAPSDLSNYYSPYLRPCTSLVEGGVLCPKVPKVSSYGLLFVYL